MDSKLKDFFYNKDKKHLIHKWEHYFDIYEESFKKFIGKNPVILEIGIFKGGSIDLWNHYFDNQCTIYAIDIDEEVLKLKDDFGENVNIIIGDQGDKQFWEDFLTKNIKFDIIIDDGGHFMNQQILTFKQIFSSINDNGVYLCEDTHSSYSFHPKYKSRLNNPKSYIEYMKKLIDHLHFYYIDNPPFSDYYRNNIYSINFYDSIVVVNVKKNQKKPRSIKKL